MRKKSLLFVLLVSALWLIGVVSGASAAEDEFTHIPPWTLWKEQPLYLEQLSGESAVRSSSVLTDHLYTVGDIQTATVINYLTSAYIDETFTVRLISDTVEIWVANDLNYYNYDGSLNPIHPNADDAIHVTDERLVALATRFQNDVLATNVGFFGDYDSHDGSNASSGFFGSIGGPSGYATDNGKRIIILVHNVRDERFYDPTSNGFSVGGYYTRALQQFMDRNVIAIDSGAWDESEQENGYSFPLAALTHEFFHLIFDDYHPDFGDTWLNEGLAEFSMWVNGLRPDSNSHRTLWQEYPENSLSLWGDQEGDIDQGFETGADYQLSYWFMLYMAGRIKEAGLVEAGNDEYISAVASLARDPADADIAINTLLTNLNAPFTFDELWGEFRVQVALFGGSSDDTSWGAFISEHDGSLGIPIVPLDMGLLRENLNFEGYDSPGVASYATNYIEIGWSEAITSSTTITLTVPDSISSDWDVITLAEGGFVTNGNVTGNILYSNHADLTDELILFELTVPENDPTLAFDALYNIENGWDFGFVQVTTDTMGATNLTSLPITGTVSDVSFNAYPLIPEMVPGFTGYMGTNAPEWGAYSHDLSAYAGQEILLAFRYSTDWASAGSDATFEPGFYLDNIKVGDVVLFEDELGDNALSIYEARGLNTTFEMDVVTFEDGNGAGFQSVETFTVPSNMITYSLGALLETEGFNEAGERVVVAISQTPPQVPDDLIGDVVGGNAIYLLDGLPPSLFTSRNRVEGSTNNSTIRAPKVYPGDNVTVTVTLDNLSRGGDLQTTGAVPAYVAVPFPPETMYITNSLTSDIMATQAMVVDDLSSVDSALPAVPGLYWHHEGVTTTADIQFQLGTAPTISVGDRISPTAHIANAAFSTSPSQYFTDLEQNISVESPFMLSRLTPGISNTMGTMTYTLGLVNTANITREVEVQFTLPDGISLVNGSVETIYTVPPGVDGMIMVDVVTEIIDPEGELAVALINPASGELYSEIGEFPVAPIPTAVTLQTNSAVTSTLFLPLCMVMAALTAVHWRIK